MQDEDQLSPEAQAVVDALSEPVAVSAPAPESPVAEWLDKALAAIERWYEGHFHRHVTEGTPVISSDDKQALTDALTSAAKE